MRARPAHPDLQTYLRQPRPPLLAVWGRDDAFFVPAGTEASLHDWPEAEVVSLDAGHFALETHAGEIGAQMRRLLEEHVDRDATGRR